MTGVAAVNPSAAITRPRCARRNLDIVENLSFKIDTAGDNPAVFVTVKYCLLELLVADHADLGHAEALGGSHDASDNLVLNQLVRTQVHFRLVCLGCHI